MICLKQNESIGEIGVHDDGKPPFFLEIILFHKAGVSPLIQKSIRYWIFLPLWAIWSLSEPLNPAVVIWKQPGKICKQVKVTWDPRKLYLWRLKFEYIHFSHVQKCYSFHLWLPKNVLIRFGPWPSFSNLYTMHK